MPIPSNAAVFPLVDSRFRGNDDKLKFVMQLE